MISKLTCVEVTILHTSKYLFFWKNGVFFLKEALYSQKKNFFSADQEYYICSLHWLMVNEIITSR